MATVGLQLKSVDAKKSKFTLYVMADDKKIEAFASEIAHVGAHNAYHIGQIVYVRKLQGSWYPSKGVK